MTPRAGYSRSSDSRLNVQFAWPQAPKSCCFSVLRPDCQASPMPAFVALLRGVNVGKGKRVPMGELRALLSALGYTGVATLLNSGNAVFRAARGTAAKHSSDIAAAISTQLKVEVPVIVKSAGELAAIIAENPIKPGANQHPRFLVAFVQDTKALTGLAAIEPLVVPPERFAMGSMPRTSSARLASWKARPVYLFSARRGKSATTRNWATVLKLHALANEADV